ncbi:hypothetical protein [Streptomyces triticirhizae]|uniref:hypothetical protein n=1 Tax=Streptomyces triticirhizae TaxID=2483353 RepID=UPI001F409ACD|nr:hypothetical protein [Streptomyces triticirhizae]
MTGEICPVPTAAAGFPTRRPAQPSAPASSAWSADATTTGWPRCWARLNDEQTMREVTAERVMLHALRGHRNSPIASCRVTEPDGQLSLRGMVFDRDGSRFVHAHRRGEERNDPAALGARVAAELLRQGARDIIEGIPH